jgi:SOS response regulatory protein OraA/RecX
MNRFKREEKPKVKKEASKVSRSLANIFSGNFLSKDNVVSFLPFIFFMTFMGILYIANGYYAEKVVRDLHKTGNGVKELRSEYITIKSELNYKSKQSQVAQATEAIEVYESTIPPTKIVVDEDDMKKIGENN